MESFEKRQEVFQDLLNRVEQLGTEVCTYSHKRWADFCDCKYPIKGSGYQSSEVTGCPELRDIKTDILRVLQK